MLLHKLSHNRYNGYNRGMDMLRIQQFLFGNVSSILVLIFKKFDWNESRLILGKIVQAICK